MAVNLKIHRSVRGPSFSSVKTLELTGVFCLLEKKYRILHIANYSNALGIK